MGQERSSLDLNWLSQITKGSNCFNRTIPQGGSGKNGTMPGTSKETFLPPVTFSKALFEFHTHTGEVSNRIFSAHQN